MIPDLRFIIGAVVSIVLLTVTAFGLGVAVQLLHQTRVGPLESSRVLAFGPNDTRLMGHNDPFARLPASPYGMRPAAEMPTVQAAQAVPPPSEAATATTPGDPDTVDERAVVDPPLSRDEDPILAASPPDTNAVATAAAEPPPGPAAAQAPIEQAQSEPAPADLATPVEAAPTAPSSASGSIEPSSAAPMPAQAASSTAVESGKPAAAEAMPTEAASVASASPETAPVVAQPFEMESDTEPVGSVNATPVEPVAATAAVLPADAVDQPKSHKAKAKAAAPKAKPKAAVHKAKARPHRPTRAVQPNASTGYNVTSDGFFGAPMPRQAGQPKALWPGN